MEVNEKIERLEKKVDDLTNLIMELVKPKPQTKPQIKPPPEIDDEPVLKPKDFQELCTLLYSDKWPEALDPGLICDINSEQDKEDRAEGILELIIDIHLEGYDILKNEKWDNWETAPNLLYTTDWLEVKSAGPYNVILLYDVLDHMDYDDEALTTKMKELKSVLSPNGRIYVRTHPWCSRHGTHIYNELNKAFMHLVFTEEEIESLGLSQQKVRKVKLPVFEYNNIFTNAGFRIKDGPYHVKKAVEPFFSTVPLIANRIKAHYKNINKQEYKSGKFPTGPLENEFIDYTLM